MRRFVEDVPELEVLDVGADYGMQIDLGAVRELVRLRKLKKLVVTGTSYGAIPYDKYPPQVIERHEELEAWLKERLPEVKEVRIARGLIDWPGAGLPKPTPPPADR